MTPELTDTPYTLTLYFDNRDDAHNVAGVLQELAFPSPDALTVFENGEEGWRVDGYYSAAIDVAALHRDVSNVVGKGLPDFVVREVPDENWVALSQAALPPVAAGRFTIHGSHDSERIAHGPNSILIDAGEAFGTAHHATTYGCLHAIDVLTRRQGFATCLDLGCGSGLLAIALARAMPKAAILASDVDQQSVLVARQNVELNRIPGGQIKVITASGMKHPEIRKRAPFDLIVANILADPLMRLSQNIARHIHYGGTLVLSGLLLDQTPAIIAKYTSHGFALITHARHHGWATLTFHKK